MWMKLPQYQRKEQKLQSDIAMMLTKSPRAYVSLSWGKQSIVIAHAVYVIDHHIPHIHWTGDEAELLCNFAEVKKQFTGKYPLNYQEKRRDTTLRDKMAEFNASGEFDGYFVGLAMDESRTRKITCLNADPNNQLVCYGLIRCTPLARWSWRDIAAYVAKYDLPLLDTYHKFGLEARTSSGSRPGSYTERAVDYISSTNAFELRKRWNKKGL